MKTVKKVKLKPVFSILLKIIGVILCVVLGVFLFYRKQIDDLKKLGYSEVASNHILFSKHKDYVMSVGENKILNIAFEEENYVEKYLDHYVKIKYVEQGHLVENINQLLKKGYNNNDINLILSHGSEESVSEFAKRDKVNYLEEFFTEPYARLENYDRYVLYADETGEDEADTVIYVNLDLDKEPYVDALEVSKFSIDMVVNKHRYLREDFVPDDLVVIDSQYASSDDLECSRIAYNAFIEMNNAASKEGYQLIINSAYRSYQDQVEIQEFYRNAYGDSYVEKYVAKPGHSEHQTGLAFDIGSRNSSIFANSSEYEWIIDHAYQFGFILRYDKRYEDLTLFRSEPWHFRYVGRDIAKYIYEHQNMSLEEYFVKFLDN